MPFGLKMPKAGALTPTKISTGGVHPLVKASMLPRIKSVKGFTANKRAEAISKAFGPKSSAGVSGRGSIGTGPTLAKRGVMSKNELHSTRLEMGRRPRG